MDNYKARHTAAENDKSAVTTAHQKRVMSDLSDEELFGKYNAKKTKVLVISSEDEVESNNSVCNLEKLRIKESKINMDGFEDSNDNEDNNVNEDNNDNEDSNDSSSCEDIKSKKISKKNIKFKKKKKKTERDSINSVVGKADKKNTNDSDAIKDLYGETKKFQVENFLQKKRYQGLRTQKFENVKENQLEPYPEDDPSPHINWAVNTVRQYYQRNVYEQYQVKEQRKMKKIKIKNKCQEIQSYDASRLKVLDIGSFDNPFAKFTDLDVTTLDSYPANESIKQGDFLDLKVNHLNAIEWNLSNSTSIKSIPEEYFDVIIFSLVFENNPSPKQRFLACKKAYRLLKTNGILCILNHYCKNPTINPTRDSGYIYYLLKITLGFLGFEQTKYASITQFHPMTFRKGICSAIWTKDAVIQLDATRKRASKVLRNKFGKNYNDTSIIRDEIYIPQDVKEKEEIDKEENKTKEASKHYLRLFLSALEYNIFPIQNIGTNETDISKASSSTANEVSQVSMAGEENLNI